MTKLSVVPSVVFVENKNQLIQQHEVRRRTKKDDAFAVEKSDRERKLDASEQSSFQGTITTKVTIQNPKVGQSYDPFAPIDKKKTKVNFPQKLALVYKKK
ncbi:LOW QUALITY PROTEIN: hypothetical protein YC2023_076398 [Brassica napus]